MRATCEREVRGSHFIISTHVCSLRYLTKLHIPGDPFLSASLSLSPSSSLLLRLKCQTSVPERERERGRFAVIRDIVTRVHVVTVRIRDGVTRYALCTHVMLRAAPRCSAPRCTADAFPQSVPRCGDDDSRSVRNRADSSGLRFRAARKRVICRQSECIINTQRAGEIPGLMARCTMTRVNYTVSASLFATTTTTPSAQFNASVLHKGNLAARYHGILAHLSKPPSVWLSEQNITVSCVM